MDPFWWILIGGLLMSALALVGSVTLLLDDKTLERLVMPLVALGSASVRPLGLSWMISAPATAGSTALGAPL